VFGDADPTWFLTWGTPAAPALTVPGDLVWSPGASTPARFKVANSSAFAQPVDWVLTSDRNWPGVPIRGTLMIAASSLDSVSIPVPVPDTVADGLNTLRFRATLRTAQQSIDGTIHIHDAATATELALISADADPDRVHLEWFASTSRTATVERRDTSGPWTALARVAPDGTGRIAYDDRGVTPGLRYGYRLAVPDGTNIEYSGETWLDVPLEARFALEGARPNPSIDGLVVHFSVPSSAPTRLEVLDVAGRRICSVAPPIDRPGSQVVNLDRGGLLNPGLYFIRLTQGPRAAMARAVVIR
jgi:hypothetical protein